MLRYIRLLLATVVACTALGVFLLLLTPAAQGTHSAPPVQAAQAPVQTALQASTAYSFSASYFMQITPTIDGVFGGTPVDYDGAASPAQGVWTATSPFIELKPFDLTDAVYWEDTDGSLTWSSGDNLWIDGNGNGIYDAPPDTIIIGAPPVGGVLLDGITGSGPYYSLAYNDVEFEDARADNNRYDDGEDIYVADDQGEFVGGEHFLVPDPDDPTGLPIAHVYWIMDEDYVYFHNDFMVDADTTFFGGAGGRPETAGFIDGDGKLSSGAGTPEQIRSDVGATTFFSTADQVAWYDADGDSTWSPGVDALWQDSSASVLPTYNAGLDSVIYTATILAEGQAADAWLSPATYDFVYHDNDGSTSWDSGEDIWALSGDEAWDYNYFDNELNWLIDGDGSASAGRGSDEPTRYDGNTWFQAADQVYFFDPDGNGEWNQDRDGLWQDVNGDGMYQALTDTLLYAGAAITENTTAAMRLLQREAVDGDGFASDGAGALDASWAGKMPRAFSAGDDVLWWDADDSYDWSAADALWHDGDQDTLYTDSPSDTLIISSTGLLSGVAGARLTFANHWIGYHDGQVAYNGDYDSGEDIYASNSNFAFDDFEITPDHRYTNGEDIYDRDWLEIWVYAEGDNSTPFGDPPEAGPDYEPWLRDVGFRVHLNGVRIDERPPAGAGRASSDYDAPLGIVAAAGWGPSRGFLGSTPQAINPFTGVYITSDPMRGVYNRHYEYRLPRKGSLSSVRSMSMPGYKAPHPPIEEVLDIVILPDCSIYAYIRWKDIRRGRNGGGFTGELGTYDTSSGEGWVFKGMIAHPPPPPPSISIVVVKNDINNLVTSEAAPLPGELQYYSALFDAFFDVEPSLTDSTFVEVQSEWGDQIEWLGIESSYDLETHELDVLPLGNNLFQLDTRVPEPGWVHMSFGVQADAWPEEPNAVITNTIIITSPGGGVTPPDEDEDESVANPQPGLELDKIVLDPTRLEAGGVVTFEIIYGNPNPVGLSNVPHLGLSDVYITDTLPLSSTGSSGWPNGDFAVDSFFDVIYTLEPGELLPGQWGRAQVVITLPTTLRPGDWFTNALRGAFFAPMLGLSDTVETELPLQLPDMPTANLEFQQVNWYRPGGDLAQADSLWGRVTFSYIPTDATRYFNLALANAPSDPGAWAVQNLPLFAADDGDYGARTASVDVNLAELGLSAGQDWQTVYSMSSVDAAIRATPPTGTLSFNEVGDLDRRAYDWLAESPDAGPFVDAGAPEGVRISAEPVRIGSRRVMSEVQEAEAHCMAGALARSLDWLSREYELGIGRSAQEIYDDLVAAGVSQNCATPPCRDEWIAAKNEYARTSTGNQIVTRVWDPGEMVDPVDGVDESGGDLATWLQDEFARGEDIELAYYYPGNAHIVTISGMYTEDGKLWVEHRDDERQGDDVGDDRGDTAIKPATRIYTDTEGDYHFGSDSNTIYFAVSESPVVPPDSVNIDGLETGYVGQEYSFVAAVSPPTTTQPIAFTWQASGQDDVTASVDAPSHTVAYTWHTTGTQTITVTAQDVVSDVHHISINDLPLVPPDSVTVQGVTTGQPDVTYYFTATARPPEGANPGTVALPITFTWQATDQLSQTHLNASSASDVVTFTWSITGAKTITVTALNVGGAVSKTHVVDIRVDIAPSYYVYLPLVLRH